VYARSRGAVEFVTISHTGETVIRAATLRRAHARGEF
jgi:hypothetical protein